MHDECFHDSLSFAGPLFAVDPAPAAAVRPSTALFELSTIAPMLSRHGQASGAREPRAIASQWSKYVFARLIIPTLVMQCSLDRALDFRRVDWAFTEDDDGTPVGFFFAADPLASDGTGDDFSSLIDDAILPVIAALSVGVGLSPRVYASNASMYFAWALEQLALQQAGHAHVVAAAERLRADSRRPAGGFNPFHAPFKTLSGDCLDGKGEPANRCRRLCCVRDLDACWDLCADCPRAVTQKPPRAWADSA